MFFVAKEGNKQRMVLGCRRGNQHFNVPLRAEFLGRRLGRIGGRRQEAHSWRLRWQERLPPICPAGLALGHCRGGRHHAI